MYKQTQNIIHSMPMMLLMDYFTVTIEFMIYYTPCL